MRRLPLAWAAVPTFLAVLLMWQAAREDSYVSDGSSNWETHPDGRWWVVAAVVIDLVAAVLLAFARDRRRRWIAGGALALIGLLLTVAAGIAISAN